MKGIRKGYIDYGSDGDVSYSDFRKDYWITTTKDYGLEQAPRLFDAKEECKESFKKHNFIFDQSSCSFSIDISDFQKEELSLVFDSDTIIQLIKNEGTKSQVVISHFNMPEHMDKNTIQAHFNENILKVSFGIKTNKDNA